MEYWLQFPGKCTRHGDVNGGSKDDHAAVGGGQEIDHAMATVFENGERLMPTCQEAKTRPDLPKRKEIHKELKSLEHSGIWRLVNRPPNVNVVHSSSQWVLKIKNNSPWQD